MIQDIPRTVKQWNVTGGEGFGSLKFSERSIPDLGDSQVLVKIHAGSLNYRDLMISRGQYPFPTIPGVIPGSDCAGTVIDIGKHVKRFKPGDKVITLFNQQHLGGSLDNLSFLSGLGSVRDGAFRSVGAFDENGLVSMPSNLSFLEGATLPCAALTAWNALYGVSDKVIMAGQWVLTQGTGGVSIFAVQFAKAAGAKVIATTSSSEKARLLKKLGADHIINYNETPAWGSMAKDLTGRAGVDHVIEIVGPKSMAQSLASIKIDGVISIVGYLGGSSKDQPGFTDCLTHLCTARAVLVGSRVQLEEMCRAIEANPEKLRPVIDSKTFKLEQLKEAYEYLLSGRHQGKICIEMD